MVVVCVPAALYYYCKRRTEGPRHARLQNNDEDTRADRSYGSNDEGNTTINIGTRGNGNRDTQVSSA